MNALKAMLPHLLTIPYGSRIFVLKFWLKIFAGQFFFQSFLKPKSEKFENGLFTLKTLHTAGAREIWIDQSAGGKNSSLLM